MHAHILYIIIVYPAAVANNDAYSIYDAVETNQELMNLEKYISQPLHM